MANSPSASAPLDIETLVAQSYAWKEQVWRPAQRRLSFSQKLKIAERLRGDLLAMRSPR